MAILGLLVLLPIDPCSQFLPSTNYAVVDLYCGFPIVFFNFDRKSRHEDSLTHLLGHVPSDGIKRKLDDYIR